MYMFFCDRENFVFIQFLEDINWNVENWYDDNKIYSVSLNLKYYHLEMKNSKKLLFVMIEWIFSVNSFVNKAFKKNISNYQKDDLNKINLKYPEMNFLS